jgi:hypothetical protein
MLKQKIGWNDDSRKVIALRPQYQRRSAARLLCDAAMNRNMVIPQPHREIANIDSAIRRNELLTNRKAQVWNVGSERGGF